MATEADVGSCKVKLPTIVANAYTQTTEIKKLKGKEVCQTRFIASEGEATLRKRKERSRSVRQSVRKGYANLASHVTITHKEDRIQKAKAFMGATVNGAMDLFVRRSNEKAKNAFGWMDWIVR